MPPGEVLFVAYGLVMTAALGCFAKALATRKNTPVHRRWGISGISIDLGGTFLVWVAYRFFGWTVVPRDPALVSWHRGVAYFATTAALLVGISGWRRWRIHPRLWPVFLPLFLVAYVLAGLAYWPW
jgi:hypothetical protein